MLIENIIMKLRKGNLHIAEIKRNSKIMEDASTEIIEHRCIERNIVKKNSSDNKTTFCLLALKQ